MSATFTRQLGSESGVQLNPLRDNSEIPTQDTYDQIFGIAMRATRGRIDKSFKVDRSNVANKLGKGEPIRVSELNEAYVHVVEALNNGADKAIVQRLVTDAAEISYAVVFYGTGAILTPVVNAGVVTAVTVTNGGTGYANGQALAFAGAGTGAEGTVTVVNGVITAVTLTSGGTGYTTAPEAKVANPISFSVLPDLPLTPFLFAVKHLECFNDGIKIDFRAEEKRAGGVSVANDRISFRLKDKDDDVLYWFYGSLDPTAKDDYENSAYLSDVAAGQTDAVEITIGNITSIPVGSPAYGYDSVNGLPNWARSDVLVCFSEGGTAYTTDHYASARTKLQFTPFNYGYIGSGGSQSAALLSQLVQLAYDTNRQLRLDIPGRLTPEEAITFVEALNLGGNKDSSHLIHSYWSPLRANDPTGVNGKGYLGVATLNIAYSCGRNARTNAKGFAPKNYVVAGREWPINRTGITQEYTPSDQELSALARAKINPVLFEVYTGGGRYVFRDSLTSALVDSSLKKLISVADMSTSIDDAVTRFGKDALQLPMSIAVKRMNDFLRTLFENAQASGWLVPSNDPFMGGAAFKFEARPSEVRPDDRMDVLYWVRYDGTNRQIFVTQTLPR